MLAKYWMYFKVNHPGVPNMLIAITAYDEVSVAHLPERLTMANASELKSELLSLTSESNPQIVLDMAGVSFTDSSGLAVLVAVYKSAVENTGEVVLLSPQPSVQSLLELTRLQEIFEIYNDVKTAVDRLAIN